MRKTKKLGLTFVALALLVAAGLLASCSAKKEAAAAPAAEIVRDLPVLELKAVAVPDGVEAVGTVRAADTAPLAAQIMGAVTAAHVQEGDRVKRGQVLAEIDGAQARASVDRAQAAVESSAHEANAAEADSMLATSTLKRYQQLLDKKAVSLQEFDEVRTRAQASAAHREMAHSGQAQAKAALAQARTMLDYTHIRAPFDGVVTDKRVEAGAMAVPGVPLVTVERTGRFRLEAAVDESKLRFIRKGQAVTVKLDALDRQLEGKVSEIVPAADAASRSFVVKVELPSSPDLHSGLFGRAFFLHGERQSLLVPSTAVVERGQLQGIYVVGGDRMVALRYVTLGRAAGDRVEVLSGLQPGDTLVVAPGTRDLGGKRIQ